MRRANIPIAVLASDLHISPNPPIARSCEFDWYTNQAYYLAQVSDLCDTYNAPLVIAGDVFNRPQVPAECVNFLMKHLPEKTYAIPGQHDLPNHRYDDLKKSSFYTLVLSGTIRLLEHNIKEHIKGNWYAVGYPWGFDITEEIDKEDESEKLLAVIHAYIWMGENKYTGAPKEKNISKWMSKLEGFDAAVFGDNHKGFYCMAEEHEEPWIMNCGSFMRRTIDEMNYKPRVGILYDAGNINEYYLECDKDKFIDVSEALEAIDKALEATDFIRELSGLGKTLIDFCEAVERFCTKNGIDKRIVSLIEKALEKK